MNTVSWKRGLRLPDSSHIEFGRIIDANANRAREGIRVVEEVARFIYDDQELYYQLRDVRQTIAQIIPYPSAERDSTTDVGRGAKPGARVDLKEIITANFRRVEEALRVLEEFHHQSAQFQDLRFKIYVIEKELHLKTI